MGRKKTNHRLSREDWLENALTVLSKQGLAGLKIQSLSTALGVSRGSFYWHFKDRDDFIYSLLEYWFEEYTAGAVAAVAAEDGTAEEKLAMVMRLVHDQDLTRHEFTVRSLATLDPRFSRMVRKTDRFRLDFIESLFKGKGFQNDDIKIRARACLAYMTVEHHMFDELDRKHQSDLVNALHAFLVRKE